MITMILKPQNAFDETPLESCNQRTQRCPDPKPIPNPDPPLY